MLSVTPVPITEFVPAPAELRSDPLHGLLIRCATHDETALAEFYRLTSPVLKALVRRRVPTRRAVEAALVDVYVGVWRESKVYVELPHTSAWEWTLMLTTQALARPVGRPRTLRRV